MGYFRNSLGRPNLIIGSTGKLYYDNLKQFIERNAIYTIRRDISSAPTTVYPSIYLLTSPVGDGGSNFVGGSGLFIKTFERTSGALGVLYGAQIQVAPSTERDYTVNPNKDATCLIMNNAGTVKATDIMYLGSVSPGKSVTASNPNGYDFDSIMTASVYAQNALSFTGKYEYGLKFDSGISWVGNKYAIYVGGINGISRLGGPVLIGGQDALTANESLTVKNGGSNHVVLIDQNSKKWSVNIDASTGSFRITETGVGSPITIGAGGAWQTDRDVKLTNAGKGLYVKEGTNATMGKATLVAGTITVNTTKVTANSRIFLTHQNLSGTAGFVYVSARTAGTSFTITSASASDTSDIAWMIVEPA